MMKRMIPSRPVSTHDAHKAANLMPSDVDLTDATISSLTRLLRDELVQACEARGIEVGGTKPQLAKALIEWVGFPVSWREGVHAEQS